MSNERLLLDTMLGKLTTYLRMCGYDAAYALDRGVEADDEVLALAKAEDRRIVTRDSVLAARDEDSILLTGLEITDQLRQVHAAGLDLSLDEPTRCSNCNGRLDRVPDDAVMTDSVPNPAKQAVWRCRDCGQLFWKGSHWDDVAERLDTL